MRKRKGRRGAAALAALIQKRYPCLEMVLDEGGLVKADGVAGLAQPVALVGVSEKGYLSLELTATGAGGHSSMPPALTSVGRVAAAVARLEAQPFPTRLNGGVSGLLAYLAPAVPFSKRLVFANQWLFGSLIKKSLAATPSGNAALRTTTAPTIIQGGDKDNVLPASATATVNFRLLPGDSVSAVMQRVREIIDDPQIQLKILGEGRDASPVSGTDNAAFAALHRTIKQRCFRRRWWLPTWWSGPRMPAPTPPFARRPPTASRRCLWTRPPSKACTGRTSA
ncbi:MAG: peptidase dimerization domain-containing protein [Hymenobacter sp.]